MPRTAFGAALAEASGGRRSTRDREWIYAPYDQLTDAVGPLSRLAPERAGLVLVECPAKAARRPYHRQKLALVLANQRHFALEQARRGVCVRYVNAPQDYATALRSLVAELGPLTMMEAAERELRVELSELTGRGALRVEPHAGFFDTAGDFAALGAPPWRMDAFYRRVRRRTGFLMEAGEPVGGRFSFDTENRLPWRGTPRAPELPRFEPDAITREVGALVEERFESHPGTLDLGALPATRSDARRSLEWAIDACLPHFGPYEDAMSAREGTLFHTRLAPLLNLHRVLPREAVERALGSKAPLPSVEGFVRQLIGWREFVRHVHRATDGFRDLPGGRDPSASPSALGAARPLPPAFWGQPSGLGCLDAVIEQVWSEGYSHHITRLMVLSNLATLLDLSPRELTDWFWVAYTDAYDWVVEPNVLGMGTYAAGPLMTTKPYVSGAPYVARMGDYCTRCEFDPKRDCPMTPLYWAFLARHRDRLAGNPRLAVPLRALDKRSAAQRAADRDVFEAVGRELAAGEVLSPKWLTRRRARVPAEKG
jgi:deoxyribodipyrimidine photolyase-related protein